MSREEVRKKILKAALELFSEKGFEAVSVEQIADAVGMKGPNLYKYYKGKADIFNELHTLSEETYMPKMRMDAQTMEWIHNREELKIFSMNQIQFTINDSYIRKMRRVLTLEQFRSKEMAARTTIHQLDNLKNQYIKIFDKLIDYGEIEPCDSEMLALEYFAPVSLYIQLCDREPDRIDEALKNIEAYIDFFIEKNFIKK
jgi:AcrR family transcriptional regulator